MDFDPIGSILGFVGQSDTNAANVGIADKQMDFQERMSNTAYQRQVADMNSAGLNPMLAYMKGGGASTPSGSTTTVTSPIQGALAGGYTSAQTAKTKAEIPKVQADISKVHAETSNVLRSNEKIGQEIDNLKTDNEKSKAFIDNIRQEYQNLVKQGLNLTDVGNQIRTNIDLMSAQITNFHALTSSTYYQEQINKMEAQLRGYDVEAAKGAGNFGREYNQFKPLIDLLRSFIRR